jgi:DNA-directed RNA polymerase subunit E'/Rpb7
MFKILNPYKNIKQYTRIALEPYYMNNNIKNNLKTVLKKKIEKKCNKTGYIDEIYNIIEYSDGIMYPENLNGCAIYNIAYHCKICIPIEGSVNVALTRIVNLELVIAINGPIIYFIPKGNINADNWERGETHTHKNDKKKLNVGDYIKIKILEKRINANDTQIKVIGELLDFANTEEIANYFDTN